MEADSGKKLIIQRRLEARAPDGQSNIKEWLEEYTTTGDADIQRVCLDLLLKSIENSAQLQSLLSQISSRLHRLETVDQYRRMAQLLYKIWALGGLDSWLQDKIRIHPELLSYIVFSLAEACYQNSQLAKAFIIKGLEDWTRMGSGSFLFDCITWSRFIANILMVAMDFCLEAELIPLIANFLLHLPVRASIEGIELISRLVIMAFRKWDNSSNGRMERNFLSYALTDCILRAKFAHPHISFHPLTELFAYVELPLDTPLQLALLHPIFSEREIEALLRKINPSSLSKAAVYMLVADYPTMVENCSLFTDAIEKTDDTFTMLPLPRLPLVHPLILFFREMPKSIQANEAVAQADFAYAFFAHRFHDAIIKQDAKAIADCVQITTIFPGVAQRTFLLLCNIMKVSIIPSTILVVFDGLVKMASLKGEPYTYCRDRSLALLKNLCISSMNLRSIIIPKLTQQLDAIPAAFEIINELTPSFLFSSEATRKTVKTFAITAYLLTLQDRRQSYLKLAMSFINAAFRNAINTTGHDVDDKSMALLILALENLVKLQYVAPKILWIELIRPLLNHQSNILRDVDFNGQLCSLLGCFGRFIPQHEEDYHQVDAVISEEIIPFLCKQLELFPSGALKALVSFPLGYLSRLGIELVPMFTQSLGKSLMDLPRLQVFLERWLQDDINLMPRSMLLGTFEAKTKLEGIMVGKNQKELLNRKSSDGWNSSLALTMAHLVALKPSTTDFAQLFKDLCLLPPLSLQHWLWRLAIVKAMSILFIQYVEWLQDQPNFKDIIKSIDTILLANVSAGLTAAIISWSLLLRFMFSFALSKVEDNKSQLEGIARNFYERTMVSERFRKNDEVLAALLLGLWSFKDNFLIEWKDKLSDEVSSSPPWLKSLYEFCFEEHPLVSKDKDLKEAFENSVARSKSELPSAKGLGVWQAGLACNRKTGVNNTDYIKTLLEMILRPGPMLRKIEGCVFIAGMLGVATSNPSGTDEIIELLGNSLNSCADAKIEPWLLILMAYILVFAKPQQSKEPIETVSPAHRFGTSSAFGMFLDFLYSNPAEERFQELLLNVLSNLPKLPRLRWTKFIGNLPNKFLINHCISSDGNFVDDDLLVEILSRIKTKRLIPRGEDLDRWLPAIKNPKTISLLFDCLIEAQLFMLIIQRHSCFNPEQIQALISIIPRNCIDIWQQISEMDIYDNPLTRLLKSKRPVDALTVLYEDPTTLEGVVDVLSSKASNLIDLASFYVLAIEDKSVDTISRAFASLLVKICSLPGLTKFSQIASLSISWDLLALKNPELATSVVKIISPIIPLIQPEDPFYFLADRWGSL